MTTANRMLGRGVVDQASATSRSAKLHDRQRRQLKRVERGCWRDEEIKREA